MRLFASRPSLLALLVLAACSSSSNGGTPAANDAGTDAAPPPDDAAPPPVFTYSPAGCAYKVTPPAAWAFQDVAVDDGAALTDVAGAAPARVRLGMGGGTTAGQPGYADPTTTAAFTWETASANHAAKVKLGTDPNALTDVHTGYAWTTPPPTSGLGVNEPATYMHEVHVCGLQPGKTYYYQVGGGAAGAEAWSATQSFTTVPATGPITIGISGDSRDSVSTLQAVQVRMRDAGASVQLYSGDLVDIGQLESLYVTALDAMWKDPADKTKFLTLGQQLFLTTAGNHENEAVRFFAAFPLPGDGDYAKTYYSFDVGTAHVVFLDDQHVSLGDPLGPDAQAQLAWLDQDLAKANADRAAHPFVIVVSHRALYSTSTHSGDKDVAYVRSKLAPLYDKYAVDLVLNGHEHEYERSFAVKGGQVVADGQGTVYVVNGGAGAEAYPVGAAMPFRKTATAFGGSTPYIGTYGVATLDGKSLTVKAYGLKMSGSRVMDDDVIDTLTLTH